MSLRNDSQTTTQDDDILSALTNPYCRFVLRSFGESTDTSATVEELSTAFAHETGGDEDRVAVQLHHAVLPELSTTGIVDYDARNNTVHYHGHSHLEDLSRIADSDPEHAGEGRR